MNTVEKRKRILYCPSCESDMLNLFDLIYHVKYESCGMTLERLRAVGVLDEGELDESDANTEVSSGTR